MLNKSPLTGADELALQLIAILGLPRNVEKLSLQFEARKAIVAEVTFFPELSSAVTATKRFSCTPIDEAAEQGV